MSLLMIVAQVPQLPALGIRAQPRSTACRIMLCPVAISGFGFGPAAHHPMPLKRQAAVDTRLVSISRKTSH